MDAMDGKLLLNRPSIPNLVKLPEAMKNPKSSRRGKDDSVLLDVEFCPPPVTPLSVVLSSK